MRTPRTHCLRCGDQFSPANTFSEAGWRETEISGFCEACFDEVTRVLDDAPATKEPRHDRR
jgi:hypothetical protein